MSSNLNASDSAGFGHTPVLLEEVLHYLQPTPGRTYMDGTLGAGGHAEAILRHIQPGGQLLGVDQDPVAMAVAQQRLAAFGDAFQTRLGNFSQWQEWMPPAFSPLSGGVLADIGVSSMQLDQGERGFSFLKEAPLDMRMGPGTALTAAQVINTYSEAALVRIFSEYGEEHLSKTLVRAIMERRQRRVFETTTDLAGLIQEIYRSRGKQEKIHPATRVFQALRIEVNDELGHLQRFLRSLPELLMPGARVVIIAFHSLEDRLIKRYFQEESRQCVCPPRLPVCQCGHEATLKVLATKPVCATDAECKRNPRARSAKLRAAVRL